MATKFRPDDAIRGRSQDRLNRKSFADHAASMITNSYTKDSSLVFGLTGPWGSGKSSLIEMIVEGLTDSDDQWLIVRFTPWAASDVNSLLGEFYSSLSHSIPKNKGAALKKALGKLARIAAPTAGLIPVAGSSIEKALSDAGESLASAPSWDAAFEEATTRLRELGRPCLVIADDIDRLQTDELWALLKVVRLLGRFPGVQYLLAYDEGTIFKSLGSDSGVSHGHRFMEKIVQYPLSVPPLLENQRLRLIDLGIEQVLADCDRRALNEEYLAGSADIFLRQLSTPRAIERFLGQLRHYLPMLPSNEIDDADVVMLSLLRTAFPTVHSELAYYKSELVSGSTGKLAPRRGDGQFETERFDSSALMRGVAEKDREDAHALLVCLFPNLSVGMSVGDSRGGPRIHNKEYFDRYLVHTIPENDVSDSAIVDAMTAVLAGDIKLFEKLMTGDGDRVYLVLSKLQKVSVSSWSADGLTRLIAVLARSTQAPVAYSGLFSPHQLARRWVGKILGYLPSSIDEATLRDALRQADPMLRMASVMQAFNESTDQRPWAVSLREWVAAEARHRFMENVLQKDDAGNDSYGFLINVASFTDEGYQLISQLEELIERRQISLDDLAARMVSLDRVSGGGESHLELGDVNQQAWDLIAPQRDDTWYLLPAVNGLDDTDISWANRKLYVRGRLTRPLRGQAAETSH